MFRVKSSNYSDWIILTSYKNIQSFCLKYRYRDIVTAQIKYLQKNRWVIQNIEKINRVILSGKNKNIFIRFKKKNNLIPSLDLTLNY